MILQIQGGGIVRRHTKGLFNVSPVVNSLKRFTDFAVIFYLISVVFVMVFFSFFPEWWTWHVTEAVCNYATSVMLRSGHCGIQSGVPCAICFPSLYHVCGVFHDVVVVNNGVCANGFPERNQELYILLCTHGVIRTPHPPPPAFKHAIFVPFSFHPVVAGSFLSYCTATVHNPEERRSEWIQMLIWIFFND